MAYRKVDNCGPVPYPDQSGRYLGAGEVVENDDANDWSPLVALGFIEKTGASATPDKQESKEELASAVKLPPPPAPSKTVGELAKIAAADSGDSAPSTVADSARSSLKGRKKKKQKAGRVSDGDNTADDGVGAEEVDSSAPRKSDS